MDLKYKRKYQAENGQNGMRKKRFGKNAIVKGMDLQEGATTIERNGQIGGHRA